MVKAKRKTLDYDEADYNKAMEDLDPTKDDFMDFIGNLSKEEKEKIHKSFRRNCCKDLFEMTPEEYRYYRMEYYLDSYNEAVKKGFKTFNEYYKVNTFLKVIKLVGRS